jgi:hypothetical protein
MLENEKILFELVYKMSSIISSLTLRFAVIEKLLLEKGIITKEEGDKNTKEISKEYLEILRKLNNIEKKE